MSDRPLVVYNRISTQQQKRSSLGLLAQQDSVSEAQPLSYLGTGVLRPETDERSGEKVDKPLSLR
jgi:hypothetical protein